MAWARVSSSTARPSRFASRATSRSETRLSKHLVLEAEPAQHGRVHAALVHALVELPLPQVGSLELARR